MRPSVVMKTRANVKLNRAKNWARDAARLKRTWASAIAGIIVLTPQFSWGENTHQAAPVENASIMLANLSVAPANDAAVSIVPALPKVLVTTSAIVRNQKPAPQDEWDAAAAVTSINYIPEQIASLSNNAMIFQAVNPAQLSYAANFEAAFTRQPLRSIGFTQIGMDASPVPTVPGACDADNLSWMLNKDIHEDVSFCRTGMNGTTVMPAQLRAAFSLGAPTSAATTRLIEGAVIGAYADGRSAGHMVRVVPAPAF